MLDTEGLIDESEDYSTLAGYLLMRFGQLPQPGDSCEYETPYFRFRFEVLRMDGRRIASVRVERSINEALEDPDNYDHD
ncbi:transporter associated domain protein [Bordetella holmesii 41130]|nr:transporter associated domain protein [Bordetella holmesii 41130]